MSGHITQGQLEDALRSHFAATTESPLPASLGRVPHSLPVISGGRTGRIREALPPLAIAATVALLTGALIGLPLLTSPQPQPSPTATPSPSPTESASFDWVDSPVDWVDSPTEEPGASVSGSRDPMATEDSNWWRSISLLYPKSMPAGHWLGVEVTASSARVACRLILDGSYIVNKQLGTGTWLDFARQTGTRAVFVGLPESKAGPVEWSVRCWSDGISSGTPHDWPVSVNIEPLPDWTISSRVDRASRTSASIVFWTESIILRECHGSATAAAGSATVEFSNTLGNTFGGLTVWPSNDAAGPVTYTITCTGAGGSVRSTSGTFDIPPPPTPAPTPTPEPPTPAPPAPTEPSV